MVMVMIRKIFCMLICVCMLVVPTGAVNDSTADSTEEVEFLRALGIVEGDSEDGNFHPENLIKRSEFAKIAVMVLALEGITAETATSTLFADVPVSHWATRYINSATNSGVIIGDDEGNFRPDDNITYQEGVAVLVRALGFEPSAQAKGGYPKGHMLVASMQGINKNVVAEATKPLTRGNVAILAYNSLHTHIMEQTNFGDNAVFEVVPKILLEERLQVTKVSGKLLANDQIALLGEPLANNSILVGETVISTGGMPTRGLLGAYVNAYLREIEGQTKLIHIHAERARNEFLKVVATDVDSVSPTIVRYFNDGRNNTGSASASISPDATLIVNGKRGDILNIARPVSGSINFIDNDQDGRFDIVMVNEHFNIVVEDVATANFLVMGKHGNSITLDPDNNAVKFNLHDIDGAPISIARLEEWDVLSVVKSADSSLLDITLSTEKVRGKVQEFRDGWAKINGTEYEVAIDYDGMPIDVGMEGVFPLDVDRKITTVNLTAPPSQNYAYFNGIAKTGVGNKELEIEVFTAENSAQRFNITERVRLNGESLSTEDLFKALTQKGVAVNQLIAYEVDADGVLRDIRTASDHSTQLEHAAGEFALSAMLIDATYNANSQKLGGISVNSQTVIFDIPHGKNEVTDYAIRDISMFAHDEQYDVYVYDVSEELVAQAIVVTNLISGISSAKGLAVVERITQTTSAEGAVTQKVYLLEEGEQRELVVAGSYEFNKGVNYIEPGDVIQYSTNAAGEVDRAEMLLDVNERHLEFRKNLTSDLELIYGKVDKRFSTSINVSVNDTGIENYSIVGATVYVADLSGGILDIRVASIFDIERFDSNINNRVLLRLNRGEVKEIVVVK